MSTPRTYYGHEITKSYPEGYWTTFIPGIGYLRADTLDGLKALIRHRLGRTRPGEATLYR